MRALGAGPDRVQGPAAGGQDPVLERGEQSRLATCGGAEYDHDLTTVVGGSAVRVLEMAQRVVAFCQRQVRVPGGRVQDLVAGRVPDRLVVGDGTMDGGNPGGWMHPAREVAGVCGNREIT